MIAYWLFLVGASFSYVNVASWFRCLRIEACVRFIIQRALLAVGKLLFVGITPFIGFAPARNSNICDWEFVHLYFVGEFPSFQITFNLDYIYVANSFYMLQLLFCIFPWKYKVFIQF